MFKPPAIDDTNTKIPVFQFPNNPRGNYKEFFNEYSGARKPYSDVIYLGNNTSASATNGKHSKIKL